MAPTILRDPDAFQKLLEYILNSPSGRRSLSRLARTSKAVCDPALNVLWRELDTFIPLIGLFPAHLLRRAKRPGMGFATTPLDEDWAKVLFYGQRVKRVSYDEGSNVVSSTVFNVIEECRPQTYILPNLNSLTWKATTPAGLDRALLFLNPELQSMVLEVGMKLSPAFLAEISSRARLSTLSLFSPVSLPGSFTELLGSQDALEKIVLTAPGALSPTVGKWIASLPQLRTLQLDLTGRTHTAVEGFFEEMHTGKSCASTPSSGLTSESPFSSNPELDLLSRREEIPDQSAAPLVGSHLNLRSLHLTGEASIIASFMSHMDSPLRQIELVIEDPPAETDWQDLSHAIQSRFGRTLQYLRVTATGSSRFNDLMRSTSRGDSPSHHLSLEYLTSLPHLLRLDIDLPESVIVRNADIACLAQACPNLEQARICPTARFTSTTPKLTLDGLAPLTSQCHRLHTLAVVVNGQGGSEKTLSARDVSSRSLMRLHVGHSHMQDPLQASILLSHIAPYLESLRWFHERNRPGFVEANARGWEKVSEYLPHLQHVRHLERRPFPSEATIIHPVPPTVSTSEKAVDATIHIITIDRETQVLPSTVEQSVQAVPKTRDRPVQAKPHSVSQSIHAVPPLIDRDVTAVPESSEKSVYAMTPTESKAILAVPSTQSVGIETLSADEPMDIDKNLQEKNVVTLAKPQHDTTSMAFWAVRSFPVLRLLDIWSLTSTDASKIYSGTLGSAFFGAHAPTVCQ